MEVTSQRTTSKLSCVEIRRSARAPKPQRQCCSTTLQGVRSRTSRRFQSRSTDIHEALEISSSMSVTQSSGAHDVSLHGRWCVSKAKLCFYQSIHETHALWLATDFCPTTCVYLPPQVGGNLYAIKFYTGGNGFILGNDGILLKYIGAA